MRLFVSYARVDKPLCTQIAEMLDIHEVWYDQRLYAGQHWWKEIIRRLNWCEGFIYLLSPESVSSEYCRKEFEIAQEQGKHIFPVLIHESTVIPEELRELQYADVSNGLTYEAVKTLLNAVAIAERTNKIKVPNEAEALSEPIPNIQLIEGNPKTLVGKYAAGGSGSGAATADVFARGPARIQADCGAGQTPAHPQPGMPGIQAIRQGFPRL